jgi:hypothetical protein
MDPERIAAWRWRQHRRVTLRTPPLAGLIERGHGQRDALPRVLRDLLLAALQLGAKAGVPHRVGEHDLGKPDAERRRAQAVDERDRGVGPVRQLASVMSDAGVLGNVAGLVHLADAGPTRDLPAR